MPAPKLEGVVSPVRLFQLLSMRFAPVRSPVVQVPMTKSLAFLNSTRIDAKAPPASVSVVPVLYTGIFTSTAADDALELLRREGSKAAPGFMKPEGIIIYQSAARMYFKKTLDKDDEWKGKAAA